jgi:L-ribulose-5-phosphate 3-epimerase
MPISRRTVLKASAAAPFLSPALAPLFANPEKRTFKIGVCEWMLGKNSPESFDVAKEIGVDGMQLTMGHLKNDMQLRKPDVRQAYQAAAKRTGLAIASIGIAEMNNVPLKEDARAEPWLAQSIEIARDLGVRVILLAFFHKNDLRDDKPGTDRVVEILKRNMPAAEKAGVLFGIESWLSGPGHMEIIDRVGSPNLKVYYDVGNSHLRGYDIYKEIRELGAKQICEFHAKDYNFIFGKGKVDFVEVRKAMDEIGYRGWIQLEGASPLGLIESYRQDRAYLKQVFPPEA